MKQFFSVILSLLLPLFAVAQSFYTVNVGTFVDAKSPQFDDIRSLGFVYAYEMEGGLSQVYLGGYDDQAKADKAADAIRKKGYRSAYVEERPLAQGQVVTVIQLATRETDKLIDWEKFEPYGPLYGIINEGQIKIVTGIYPDVEAAKPLLPNFRSGPFKDAFVKNVNNTLLIRINQFETGLKQPLIPISLDPAASASSGSTPTNRPTDYGVIPGDDRLAAKSGTSPVTSPTVRESGTLRSNIPRTNAGKMEIPDINSKVKRRSALELQKILKAENTYTSTLDGYYGPGTENGYKLFKQTDPTYQKYLVLARYFDPTVKAGAEGQLQLAINNLLDDPSAPLTVESSTTPIAKAYQAYILFRTMGPGNDVNALMNQAIRASYNSQTGGPRAPFDYNATYAYQGLDQLILHLHYLHAAPGNDIAAPCWLYEEHPAETAAAHASFARYSSETFKLQSCDQFLSWEEIQVLESIASDLNADAKPNENVIATYASARAQLFLAPRALDAQENQFVDQWNDQLWANLNAWGSRDPLHQKLVTALKVAYFQSQVRLEDYYMNKGFSLAEAKGLALATLKTIVGYPLERFV
ncbi:hypothetical protein [Flavilitoribacter nigricans]|uniref:SPOR domain-containing protein n=1 Tax=Flavilitoribacter nigricans (strain ATCC 23147 / DSM 23189 / NBRC 102662 / NCIMB 1420 / SS-2) TaxID=1122177 RepID=A0A2D0N5K2_FLAN2|nr:hypothetical protein [Flavilitoribacter nigricans]PHN03053.1 hypothetical protein CRP01_28645 [Flavilitoribacter nigricans DSM 23189 = NBRC 102662]